MNKAPFINGDMEINHNSFTYAVDIFSTMSREDRIRILLILQSRRHAVTELTHIIHGDVTRNRHTQTSAMLSPMRRLGLVKQIRVNKYVYYELTNLGREVICLVVKFHEHKTKQKKLDRDITEIDSDE
jgi:DNA-binding transcriptional ArsR family regulator